MEKKSNKIQVWNGIVEIDGDEMAHVLWEKVKQKLILPYIEFFDLRTFDLSAVNRNKTDDQVTIDACKAIRQCKVAVKCSTMNPTEQQLQQYNIKKLPSASNLIRNFLGGTIFKTPIICKNVPKLIPQWKNPIVIARHAEYAPFDFLCDFPGTFEMQFTPSHGGQVQKWKVHDFTNQGCAMVQYNSRESIEQFAYSCFNYSLEKQLPLYLSTKNTILKKYDGLFKDIFQEIYESSYKNKFQKRNIFYEHRLIDDMVAFMVKCAGGFLWACKGYDGDVQSEIIANGNGNKFLMLSELINSHNIQLSENSHGIISDHYKKYKNNEETSSNPISTIFVWTKGLYHRGQMDKNGPLKKFCKVLEDAAIQTIESGNFTQDVAKIVYKNMQPLQKNMYMNTDDFINKVAENLSKLQNTFLNIGSKL